MANGRLEAELNDVRAAASKGYCYPQVQAIIVSIDQYAEGAGQPGLL